MPVIAKDVFEHVWIELDKRKLSKMAKKKYEIKIKSLKDEFDEKMHCI